VSPRLDPLGRAFRGGRAVAVELAWISARVAMYPLGLLDERSRPSRPGYSLDGLRPTHRGLIVGDVEAAGTPIVLVHGVVDNRSVFTVLRRGLRRRGFDQVSALNFSMFTDDVRDVAARLADSVEAICEQTGYERLHLVGHSMGGLVVRYYVQRLGGDARVHTAVTLGAPHAGTYTARWVPHRVARQLRPGSDLIAELAEPAPGCRTRFLAFWSDHDEVVVPGSSACIDHPDLDVRNVLVRGVGHIAMPIDGRVVHEIGATLAHLDPDGRTLRDARRARA
jgi:pimeloyl-ACP methyl ester carboxylesterase